MKRYLQVASFAEWRNVARELLTTGAHPDSVSFTNASQEPLFTPLALKPPAPLGSFTISKAFLEIASFVAMHRSPERWDLLYRILYRMVVVKERHLLSIEVDPDIRQLFLLRKALARDIHKMHAFVRFRKVIVAPEEEQYIAWHRPDHNIVEHVAPWFAKRFGDMHWAILTPDGSAYWDTAQLRFGPGLPRSAAPAGDELEDLWLSYYASIFNPARVKVNAMKKEMPVRHWATLPETQIIPGLLLEASNRVNTMRNSKPPSAEEFLPEQRTLPVLANAIRNCQGCDLYLAATQPVFGQGPAKARILFVGEQPGDQEDLQGVPFVGPAGQLLNKALEDVGIDRSAVYVSNAVKHFKFEERGKRRLHKKPKGSEIAACRPWIAAETAAVNPEVIVALGASAALSIGGREFAIQKERGQLLPIAEGRQLLVTVHPSFLLRLPDSDREAEYRHFTNDLKLLLPYCAAG